MGQTNEWHCSAKVVSRRNADAMGPDRFSERMFDSRLLDAMSAQRVASNGRAARLISDPAAWDPFPFSTPRSVT